MAGTAAAGRGSGVTCHRARVNDDVDLSVRCSQNRQSPLSSQQAARWQLAQLHAVLSVLSCVLVPEMLIAVVPPGS